MNNIVFNFLDCKYIAFYPSKKAKTLFFLKLKVSIHTVLRVQISYLFFTFQQLILFYSYRSVPLTGLRQPVKPFTRSLHLNESENKLPK